MIIKLALYILGILGFWQLIFKANLFRGISIGKNRKELLISICNITAKSGHNVKLDVLPQYKFYTSLVENLYRFKAQFGVPVKATLMRIKRGIQQDDKMENQLQAEKNSSYLQMSGIIVMTWFFVYYAMSIFSLPISRGILYGIGLWQLIGLFLFMFIMNKLRKSYFAPYSLYFGKIYAWQSLMDVGLPLGEINSKLELNHLLEDNSKRFEFIRRRMSEQISNVHKYGNYNAEETEDIVDQLWSMQEETFKRFQRVQSATKLIVIAIFFVSSYFAFLGALILKLIKL
ncbi:MAG: hypothetical protein ACOCUH_02825 [Bacteriovoracia bacterium]